MSPRFQKELSSSGSQLRSCLTSLLSPDHEAELPIHLGAATACLGSSAAIRSAEPQVLHRVRVRLSALLQSHSSPVRLCGAELVYSLAGADWESLASHGGTWIKLLLTILEKRNDNLRTSSAVIRALCKLFSLTHGKSTLTRELATPNIPPFVTSLLALSSSSSQPDVRVLSITLPALYAILRDHPTTFRPFTSKLSNNILYPILNSSSRTGKPVSYEIERLARKVYVSLYLTVPKDQLLEWRIAIMKTIGEMHKAISRTFDMIDEDADYRDVPAGWDTTVDIQDTFVGVLRIEMLLRTLESFLSTSTQSLVQVPISHIVQLVDRLLSLDPENIQFKQTSDRTTRDFILSLLPSVHANVYGLLTTLVKTAGQSLLPHSYTLLSHVATIPSSRNSLYNIPLYTFLAEFLSVIAFVPATLNSEINHAVELALSNLSSTQHTPSSLPDFASHPQAFISQPPSQLTKPAINFLAAVVGTVPDLPATTRSLIDRFSILRNHAGWEEERLLLEGVLQPGRNIRWSILPMVSRKLAKSHNLGSILHPRFPPVPMRFEDTLGSLAAADLEYLAGKRMQEPGNDEDENEHDEPDLEAEVEELPRITRNATLDTELEVSTETASAIPSSLPEVKSAKTPESELLPERNQVGDVEPVQPQPTADSSKLQSSTFAATFPASHVSAGRGATSARKDTAEPALSSTSYQSFKIVVPIVSPPTTSQGVSPVEESLVLDIRNEPSSERKRSRESITMEESKRPKIQQPAAEERAVDVEQLNPSSDRAGTTQTSQEVIPVDPIRNRTASVEGTSNDGMVLAQDGLGTVIETSGIRSASEKHGVKQSDGRRDASDQDVPVPPDEAGKGGDDGVDNPDDFLIPPIDTEWSSDED
ncbi:rRNA processing/ribosome biogenesis-domain-containing protein [Lipomyces tetrasporus]|uniref:Pre-rRNA-processing protein RIX1 n=1 Tax=Lipomyces tetrasporus TaxID=54092 RepID=A0AAD7QUZ0_9ASCO|nr:rRNA processing/ribosome biogenesis-domain-containing protein [Lipomyces tetrasporus]KAJ8101763.1 rRNA processing/ribosome biogenesis-domain-containing protein [Lipomyces tetrasporus]